MGMIKALRALLGIILCLVLGISVWLAVQSQVFHREDIPLFGMNLRAVKEDSMAPALSPGDLAVVVSRETYDLGDVVLCGEEERSFLRLVGTAGEDYLVRTDSQQEGEETLFSPEAVQGEVVAALAGAGTLAGFLGSLWGPPAVLVAGAFLLVLPSLLGVGREPKERKARTAPNRGRHAR